MEQEDQSETCRWGRVAPGSRIMHVNDVEIDGLRIYILEIKAI